MKTLIVFSFITLATGLQAQVEKFYGNYYIATETNDHVIVLEKNCWTLEFDELIVAPAEYEDFEIELVFNSFHAANLMGKVLASDETMIRTEVYDPDMEEPRIETYRIQVQEDETLLLVHEDTETAYILVRASKIEGYPIIECPVETEIEEE